ncbi:response regulator [Ferrovibrio sp.]|uniref:response regulator transcription factor n=1 Tax=Ferrovibrio sp. TaxID=1917215 RepID=UPI002626D9D1|nr:response regulator [Ferrovibrio sp.]
MADSSVPLIYVIDDDDVVRDSLKALLQVRRYAVQDFESGERFLAADPDLSRCCLILDVHMPNMTGIQLLQAMRDRGKVPATILITGKRDASLQNQANDLGVLALLDKPLSHAALFEAIEQALAVH